MSQSYSIRGFRPSDCPGLEMLHRRAILALAGGAYTEAECRSWAHGIRARIYARIAVSRETFVVAEMGHGPIGGFCSYARDGVTAGRICGLYTDPSFQGLGIATWMMTEAEQAMVLRGVENLVVEASLGAVTFYERHGYREVERSDRATRGGLMITVAHLTKPASDAL